MAFSEGDVGVNRGDAPLLSSIICTHNRYDLLPNAIESLLNQRLKRDRHEILIVDNSPDRTSADAMAKRYEGAANLRYIFSPLENLSLARNLGAETARADIVAYLDDDAIADPEWAQSLIDAYRHFGEETGIVGGPVTPIWEHPPPDWLTDRCGELLSLVDRGPELHVMDHGWLAGCNISFHRKTLLRVGGFPVALGRSGGAISLLSSEETHVCERIRAEGKKMIYAPRAAVGHVISALRCDPEWLRRRMAWQAVSDAISRPETVAKHVRFVKERDERARQKIRLFLWRLRKGPAKPASFDDELDRIYDVTLTTLCGMELS